MEVKHGENTSSDKRTIFSILVDAKVLSKLIEAGAISSAAEMSPLGGYSAEHHTVVHDGGKNIINNKKKKSNFVSNALQCHLQLQKLLTSYLLQFLASAVHL